VAATGVPFSKAEVRAALAPGGAAGVCAEMRRATAAAALGGPGVAAVRAFFDAVGGLPLQTCCRMFGYQQRACEHQQAIILDPKVQDGMQYLSQFLRKFTKIACIDMQARSWTIVARKTVRRAQEIFPASHS